MKKSFLKRTLCLLTALLMIVPMLSFGVMMSYADTGEQIYLTDLDYESVVTLDNELRFDSNITIGTDTYGKGIYLHPLGAGDANAASIVYNIKNGGYTKFSVWVGKDSAGEGYGNLPLRFELYVDDILVSVSNDLRYPEKEKLEVTLPGDASTLKLVAKASGSAHYACGSTFAEPILTKRATGTLDNTVEKSLTDLTYSDLSCLFGATDPFTTQTEGELRINNNISIGQTSFNKGIYLHPVAAGSSAYITYDISGKGFKSFRTYVGKDSNGNGWGNNVVQFEIYVDDVLMATSKELRYPSMEELSVVLPEDAKQLKLVAKALGSHSATGCCFGNPVLTMQAEPVGFAGYQFGKNAIRFIGYTDSLEYDTIDLVITATGSEKTYTNATTKVFTTLRGTVDGEVVNVATCNSEVDALMQLDYNHLYGYEIVNIPAGEYTFTIVPTAQKGSQTLAFATAVLNVTVASDGTVSVTVD